MHDGSAYRLYLRRSGDPRTLYQASWVAGTDTYQFGHNSIPAIPVVDCGAGRSLEAELFGQEGEGARRGAIELGEGGTLVLDDVGEARNGLGLDLDGLGEGLLDGRHAGEGDGNRGAGDGAGLR